jgi:hypothetical protein
LSYKKVIHFPKDLAALFQWIDAKPAQLLLLEGMTERPNFVRKSMPSKGVVTAANKKIKLKNLSHETDRKLAKSPSRDSFAIGFEGT